MRRWQRENPDKVAEYMRRWREKNPAKVAAAHRRRQQAKPVRVNAKNREWYQRARSEAVITGPADLIRGIESIMARRDGGESKTRGDCGL
jgi:hypothetical protein